MRWRPATVVRPRVGPTHVAAFALLSCLRAAVHAFHDLHFEDEAFSSSGGDSLCRRMCSKKQHHFGALLSKVRIKG